MLDYKKIGLYLLEKRKMHQLTQKQLADQLNISFQAVSRWEKGVSQTKGYWEITCVYLLANKRILLLS